MTSPARSCATENWVGINKKDFYSLIDRIYSAEEERMSQTENQSTSSDVKHTADDARNDVTSSHRPRSADGNSSDGNEDTREEDCGRTRSPDVEQSFRDMPALHETYIRKDHIDDTPLDLTRHGRGDRMTSSPIRSSSQTTPFSLLAGMGGLNHLLVPGGNSQRLAAKSAVKAKMAASGKSPEPRQNLKAITNTTATTAKGELLRHSKTAAHKSSPSTVLLQDDGAQKSPKECWVRVNKNMVANLVENLVETSLCRDDAYCLSGTASIDDSECLEAR